MSLKKIYIYFHYNNFRSTIYDLLQILLTLFLTLLNKKADIIEQKMKNKIKSTFSSFFFFFFFLVYPPLLSISDFLSELGTSFDLDVDFLLLDE